MREEEASTHVDSVELVVVNDIKHQTRVWTSTLGQSQEFSVEKASAAFASDAEESRQYDSVFLLEETSLTILLA